MSVKFEKETVTKVTEAAQSAMGGKGKDDLVHQAGEMLTKGGGMNGYLAVSGGQLRCDREHH